MRTCARTRAYIIINSNYSIFVNGLFVKTPIMLSLSVFNFVSVNLFVSVRLSVYLSPPSLSLSLSLSSLDIKQKTRKRFLRKSMLPTPNRIVHCGKDMKTNPLKRMTATPPPLVVDSAALLGCNRTLIAAGDCCGER